MKYIFSLLVLAGASASAHQIDGACEKQLVSPPQTALDSLNDAHLKAYRNGQLSEYMLKQGGIATILDSLNEFAKGSDKYSAHEIFFSVIIAKDWTVASRPEGEAKVRILRGFAPKIYEQTLKRLQVLSDKEALDSNESFYLTQIAGMMITEAMQKHDPNEAAAIAKIMKLSLGAEIDGGARLNSLIFGRWNLATPASQKQRLLPSIQEVALDDDHRSFTTENEREAVIQMINRHTTIK